MMIKDFCKMAMFSKISLKVVETNAGFCVGLGSSNETIQTQRGKTRFWKSFDVLLKHLKENQYQGIVEFELSNQLSI